MTTIIDKNAQKRRWTPEQQTAIDVRDKTLLVSAAAGSGKTAVLTERIIKTLLDKEHPTDITELLIVTFTNAAAAEMRERIGKALGAAAAQEPKNRHLQKQLMLLPSAKIRTIDSFCNDILKTNSERVAVSPSYRIGDAAEQQLLAYSIFEVMINSIYDGNLPEVSEALEFEELADCLTDSKKMDRLAEVFYSLYMQLSCAEGGVDEISKLREVYNPASFVSQEKTIYGRHFINRLREACAHYKNIFLKDMAELATGSPEEQDYVSAMRDATAKLELIISAESFADISSLLDAKTESLPRKKAGAELSELQELAKEHKSKCQAALRSFKKIFSADTDEWRYLFLGLYSRIGTLYKFMKYFDDAYLAEKRARAMFGYHDIERFVYQILWNDGKKTDAARAMASEYKAVYIDEYQDVNALQNKIFEALSKKRNRFMVGDIKQSIYSFRSAEPEIFAKMKKSFPPCDASEASDAASVFMSANFRCDAGIVDLVNGIFDKLFSLVGDNIGYKDADKLTFAKCDIPDIKLGRDIPTVLIAEDPGTEAESDERKSVLPMVVAEKIRELLDYGELNDGSPIMPKDIAIIMRNARGRASDYAAALKSVGIPAKTEAEKNIFLNSEILLVLCLLNTIDNPRRDIYLAGLLRSPIFDFSADELYLIASGSKKEALYKKVVEYCAANPDFQKGGLFLQKLSEYRDIAESSGADELIYKLYNETGLTALAAENGSLENLTVLYNYARTFEASTYKGLHSFISFINTVIDRNGEFQPPKDNTAGDEVNIMTVHTSKGLEYPVVFFVDAQKKIQKSGSDDASKLTYSGGYGISFCLRTPSGLGVVESPVDTAVREREREIRFEEEMRVLYVALTRARERLFIVGSTANDPQDYIDKMRAAGEVLSPYSLKKMQTFLDIITATRPHARIELRCYTSDAEEKLALDDGEYPEDEKEHRDEAPQAADGDFKAELLRRFKFEYPRRALSEIPEKMSASELYPTVLDGSAEASAHISRAEVKDTERARRLPDFFSGIESNKSAKRGIATHLFMQFCDLENIANRGTENELLRLCAAGFISDADSARVRRDEIAKFAESELFFAMRSAKKIYREFRFNVRLPAELFAEDKMRIEALRSHEMLVQGVIDCIIENSDGRLRLIDYKTDRLSREELADIELARASLAAKHMSQLNYYMLAVEKIFGKAPEGAEIYSLPLGKALKII